MTCAILPARRQHSHRHLPVRLAGRHTAQRLRPQTGVGVHQDGMHPAAAALLAFELRIPS